jgi:crescentin
MGFGRKLFSGFFASDPLAKQPAKPEAVREQMKQNYSFDQLGGIGEQLGERISFLTARFNEIQTLRDDFAELIKPLDEFVVSHSRAQIRLAEQEVLLSQQLKTTKSLRKELTELRTGVASSEGELSTAQHMINVLQRQSTADADIISRMKSEAGENASRLSNLERQLATELEKNAVLHDANQAKTAELIETDRQANANRAKVAELRDAAATATVETARLQALVEQIQPELARAKQRITDLETTLHTTELNLHSIEEKVALEQRGRELLQSQHAQERTDLEAALAAMSLQVDGLNSRHTTSLKHLEQARTSGNERAEAAQKWERASKDADASRIAAERRLATAEEQARFHSEQNRSLEHSISESKSHNEGLLKAIAAKDVQITQLQNKTANLESHYAALAQELEREKLQSEAVKRRLAEELENEKAERALAQGALAIARSSREKMAAQIETLKRLRPTSESSTISPDEEKTVQDGHEETNVHLFRPTDSHSS